MSLFVREREHRAASMMGQSGILSELQALRGITPRGVSLTVTPDTALRHSAVSACVQLIANLAMLDVRAYEVVDGREVLIDREFPILSSPSSSADAYEWRRQVFLSWLTRGTAFGIVTQTDRLGYPTMLELLPASCVTVDGRGPFGPWIWRVNNQIVEEFPRGPLWVARGLHSHAGCPVGISPIEMALGAIKLGLQAEDFGASWFGEGAHPSAILTTDQPVTAEVAGAIKGRFIEAIRGRREPAVLGAGMKYQAISVPADESQFLETIDKNAATVCRYFLVPPSEIGASEGDSMTYANAEARSLALLSRTFAPWIARLEHSLSALLPKSIVVRADVSGLLRTDMKTRSEIDNSDLRAGIRSRDEIRATRGLGPSPDGELFARLPFGAGEEPDPVLVGN